MPARAFFVMLKAARRLRASDYVELCDIAYIPAADSKYHQKLQTIYYNSATAKTDAPHTPAPTGPVVDSASDEAMYAFMNAFSAKRGGPCD